MVVAGKLEKSTKQAKWVKELLKHATVIDCQKVYPSQFPSWLQNRLTAYDLGIDRDALEMFVALTEGNLIVAKQSIERLLMMEVTGRVTMEDVSQCVADGAHFDLFQLTEAAIMRKPERVHRIFERLKSEGMRPEQMLAVLYWEIKNLMDASLDIDNGLSVNNIPTINIDNIKGPCYNKPNIQLNIDKVSNIKVLDKLKLTQHYIDNNIEQEVVIKINSDHIDNSPNKCSCAFLNKIVKEEPSLNILAQRKTGDYLSKILFSSLS